MPKKEKSAAQQKAHLLSNWRVKRHTKTNKRHLWTSLSHRLPLGCTLNSNESHMLEKQAFRVRWGHKRYTSGTRLHSRKYGCTSSIRVKATGNDWLGEENHPLLDKDRKDAVSDYIGGKEWREMRERYPRVFPDVEEDKGEESSEETNDLQEAVFPDDFYGTRLQRSVFPEDTGSRAYIEYDTLPAYEGDVLRKAEDAAELLEQGHIDSNEVRMNISSGRISFTDFYGTDQLLVPK